MGRLLKRRNLQQRLNQVVKEIGQKTHEQFALTKGDVSESYKIASDNLTHYVLIKKALEHDKKPTAFMSRKVENPKVLEQSLLTAPSDDDFATEDLIEHEQHEFSQQELFAIMGSENHQQAVVYISSSDGDSDFEEVPQAIPSPVNRLILDIPINPSLAYEDDDDMFADVFASAISQKMENSTKHPDAENSMPANVAEVLFMRQKPCEQTNKPISTFQPTERSPSLDLLEVDLLQVKEYDDLLPIPVHLPPMGKVETTKADVFSEGVSSFPETYDQSLSENCSPDIPCLEVHVANVHEAVVQEVPSSSQGLQLEDATFVGDIDLASPVGAHAEGPLPCDDLLNPVLISNSDEICKISEMDKRNGTEELVGERFEARIFNVTDRSLQIADDLLLNTSEPREQHVMSNTRREELEAIDKLIHREQSILIQQHGKQERLAASITDQMYSESQVRLNY